MKLDIRMPIGVLFTVIGILLVVQGVLGGAPTVGPAAGVNIDALWGTVLMVFGAGMWLLARRARAVLRKDAG